MRRGGGVIRMLQSFKGGSGKFYHDTTKIFPPQTIHNAWLPIHQSEWKFSKNKRTSVVKTNATRSSYKIYSIRCPYYLFWTLSSACSGEEALGFERSHQWSADYRLCLNPTSQRYARGALVTSFRVGWLSEIVGYCNMADYSCNNICDLPTVKRRDWTRHEHYNMFHMWRIHCWV